MSRRFGRTLSPGDLRADAPDRIGRYQVETSIGVGGFARVFRAYDESLDDSVAIKVLAENWAEDVDIRERFVEEARLLRRVRSPFLVTVHDIGDLPDGRPFFVMEFADAGTLAARLSARRTPGLDTPSARLLIETLAGGLGALHNAGVIHRDVNPKNLMIRHSEHKRTDRAGHATMMRPGLIGQDERVLLGDLGLAKDVIRAGSGAVSMVGGTAHYIPPEQADPRGIVSPATDVYAATGVIWECLTGTYPPDPPGLAGHVGSLDEVWRTFFSTGLATDAEARFQTMAAWREAALACLSTEGVMAAGLRSRFAQEAEENPYMGLAAFQPEDSERFFGRDLLIEELVDRLRQKRMLIVAGPSGSGTSSLVRAGLIPAIAGGAISGSERWPIALMTPGADLLNELAYQLSKLALSATQQSHRGLTGQQLGADPNQGRLIAETVTDATGGALLVIDQFEELFTQGRGRDGQLAVIDVLGALVDSAGSKVRIVAAVRADFYGQCASFPWLAEKITDNQVLVGPMTRAELREAIEEPAHRTGLVLEPGVVDAVLDEGGSEPGTLPLVSHVLAETWRRRRGSTMTLDGYRQAGGVSGAIAQTADTLFERFSSVERDTVRRLMLRLISPGEGTPDTRRTLRLHDVITEGDGEVPAAVAEKLTAARLLTVSEDTIEIAHEALIRTWPRLRQWIEENRDDLRMRQHIARAASEWIDQGRSPDLLYRGTPLQSALEWADSHSDVLEAVDREFLESSRQAADAKLAEQASVAARRRRIRRVAVSVLALLTVVAVTATVIALRALRQTEAQFAQSLATQSVALASDNPRLALALAVEAIARGQAASVEARTTLVEAGLALAESPLDPAASGSTVGDALSLAMRPDGALIALGYRDGTIQFWDPMRGESLGDPITGHERAVNDLQFSADGSRLVTVSDDETVRIWDVADPTDVPAAVVAGTTEGIVWRVAMSPDGTRFATASEDGTVREWDLAVGAQLGEPVESSTRDFLSVAYSPDGRTLLAGNGRGEVHAWDVVTREPTMTPFNAHLSDLWLIAFHPNGSSFVTSSSDGSVQVWDADGAWLAEPYAGPVTGNEPGIAFASDGTLYVGTADGRVGAWEGPESRLVVTTLGHGSQVTDIVAPAETNELVSLGTDQTFRIWTAGAEPLSQALEGSVAGAFGVAIAPDGTVATGDGAGTVRIYATDAAAGTDIGVRHEGAVNVVAFNESGDRLVTGGEDGTWWLVDLDGAAPSVGPIPGGQGSIDAVATIGDTIVTGGADGTVKMWNADGMLIRTLGGHHAGGVTALATTSDRIASSDRSGSVRLYDGRNGRLVVPPFAADDNTIWALAFSPDGSRLATASADENVTIWALDGLVPLAVLTPHGEGATGVSFLDEHTVVSLALDGTVRLWDVELGRQLGRTLSSHHGDAWHLAAHPSNGIFATTSLDGTVQVWMVMDTAVACDRSDGTFDAEQQRRYLGEDNVAVGCAGGQR